jgi:hypothetical protein
MTRVWTWAEGKDMLVAGKLGITAAAVQQPSPKYVQEVLSLFSVSLF